MKKYLFFVFIFTLCGCGPTYVKNSSGEDVFVLNCNDAIYDRYDNKYPRKGGKILIKNMKQCGYDVDELEEVFDPNMIDQYCKQKRKHHHHSKYLSVGQCRENIKKAQESSPKFIDEEARSNRTVLNAVDIYDKFYFKGHCFHSDEQRYERQYYFDGDNGYNFFINGGRISSVGFDEYNNVLKIFSKPDLDYKCFVTVFGTETGEYKDQSDECVLMRRNSQKSSICFYDYKRYLPANTKINTDTDFLRMVEAFLYFKKQPKIELNCDEMMEITSAEREQCFEKEKKLQEEETQKQIKYLEQLSTKTVPLCKNVHPKEYKLMKDLPNRQLVCLSGYSSSGVYLNSAVESRCNIVKFEYDYKCDMGIKQK